MLIDDRNAQFYGVDVERAEGLAGDVVGVAIGAAIGAGTNMWWMMGVLGGTFPGFAKVFTRTSQGR